MEALTNQITACAPPARSMDWNQVNWSQCHANVRRLQARIVKATQEGRWGKTKSLQYLLTHSFSGKALAVKRVTENKGKNTPGVDMTTWTTPEIKSQAILSLSRRNYKPEPLRKVYIPKSDGRKRALGIPTMRDRAMQALYLSALYPIAETKADPHSYGFRPERSTADAIDQCFTILSKAQSASWIFEGDIKGCFDHIDHHQLMKRIHTRVADRKLNRLIVQFLKSGVLAEDQFLRTDAGTPQGGIISPLLANIALSVIEERYERWVNHQKKTRQWRQSDGITAAMNARMTDRKAGRAVFFPIRYADDFVVLVSGSLEDALREKEALEVYLKEQARLILSPEKTKVTSLREGFEFLGHRVCLIWDWRYGYTPRIEIPKGRIQDFRYRIKQLTLRRYLLLSLVAVLRKINPILRGWGHFYRFCTGAKRILCSLDWYVGDRLWRWLRKKYPKARVQDILHYHRPGIQWPNRRLWREGTVEQFLMGHLQVQRFKRGWMGLPDYAMVSGEPDA